MLGLICSACSVTRKIPEGQYLLQKVKIDADKSTPRKAVSYTHLTLPTKLEV